MSSYLLKVRNGDGVVSQGTGWFVENGLVVTAFHVVGNPAAGGWRHEGEPGIEYRLRISDSEEVSVTPVLFDGEADVALLTVDTPAAYVPLPLTTASPDHGQTWRAVGFPLLRDGSAIALNGAVSDVNNPASKEALQLTAEQGTDVAWDGLSGAPVIIDGAAVGVMTQMTGGAATLWAASGEAVAKLIERLPYDLSLCHNAHDEKWVEVLARNLNAKGYRVYFDKWAVAAGRRPTDIWERVLGCCETHILVVTPEVFDSGWVKQAYQELEERKTRQPNIKIVVVIPYGRYTSPILGGVIEVDFRRFAAYPDAFSDLLTALGTTPVTVKSGGGRRVPLEIPTKERFCLRSTDLGTSAFVDDLFRDLKIHRSPPVLILAQAGRHQESVDVAIKERASTEWGEDRAWWVSLPFSRGVNNNALFRSIANQCGFRKGLVRTNLNFQTEMEALLAQGPLFLMVAGIENASSSGQDAVAGTLRTLWEKHMDTFKLVIVGGKDLADLKYASGTLSLLNVAAEKRCPELGVPDILSMAGEKHLTPGFTETDARRLLSLTGGHPGLVLEGINIIEREPGIDWQTFKEKLGKSDAMYRLFTCYWHKPAVMREINACLKEERLGAYRPYILNRIVSELYWKNLLTICSDGREEHLVWRSDVIRERGSKILNGET